jgi:LysM domain
MQTKDSAVHLGDRGVGRRCLVVWSLTSAGAAALAGAVGPHAAACWSPALHGGLGGAPFDRVLVGLAATALLACTSWLWLAVTVAVLEAGRCARRSESGPARRLVPAGVRRLVLAACGVALAGGVAHPASAAPGHHPHRQGLSGLPLPVRAVAPPHRSRSVTAAHTGRGPRTPIVVVAPGDSLWRIAAADLPPRAPDARIAARWRAIYAANRDVIGPDPDVIVPGQRLVLPRKDPS